MDDERPLGDRIVAAAYPSFYVADLAAAEAFYARVLGPTEFREGDNLVGFPLGDTWLTLFRTADGPHPHVPGPRNAEFAIQVKTPEDVDRLYGRLVDAGAKPLPGFEPKDTWMYRRMRFSCVDDPFGIRIDVLCPLPEAEPGPPPDA